MKAEILLRRVCKLYDFESVCKTIDESLKNWGMGVDVVESMICLSDDGELRNGTKLPVLTAKRREWVERWMRHRQAQANGVKTAAIEFAPIEVPVSGQTPDGTLVPNSMEPPRLDDEESRKPFALQGDFAKSYAKDYLKAGQMCGYLNSDFSCKNKVRSKFYAFALFIGGGIGISKCRKKCGLQWFGDKDAFKNVRPRDNGHHYEDLKELQRVFQKITSGGYDAV